jgi:hypothetical protein
MFWLVLFACTSRDSLPGKSSSARLPASESTPTAQNANSLKRGALEVRLKGPAIAAKPKLERPKGCSDDAPAEAAAPGPLANAVVWADRGSAPPRTAKIAWSGCRPSDTVVALTPRSAIEVRNVDPVALEIGITPWPGSAPPTSWRTLPAGATAGVALPTDPGLYLLVDKNHEWAKVLVAIGAASAESLADGIVRFPDLSVGPLELHVAHPDLERVVDLRAEIVLGLTTLDVDLGDTAAASGGEPNPAPSPLPGRGLERQ